MEVHHHSHTPRKKWTNYFAYDHEKFTALKTMYNCYDTVSVRPVSCPTASTT